MSMIVINGRFLSQNVTGVQRFAYEIILELDKIVEKNQIKLIAPQNQVINLKLKNIDIERKGKFRGQLWEQIELPLFLKKGDILLNLCNTAPFIKTGVVTIHDISSIVDKSFYNWKFRLWYRLMNSIIVRKSQKILTVSEFSKNEILNYYKVNEEKIEVIYNGWQHLNKTKSDKGIMKKLKIDFKDFYLGVSSLNPNKNFEYIIRLAKKYPKEKFIVVGKMNGKIFGDIELNNQKLDNLIFTGYLTDEEIKVLYENAKLFIYPSFYEGFGIPPLEALACGTDILISNTSCLPEIFGERANYLNPSGELVDLGEMKAFDKEEILEKYSWEKSAIKIKKVTEEII